MSASLPVVSTLHRWHDGALHAVDYCDPADATVLIADSWLVDEGVTLALALHRERFSRSLAGARAAHDDFEGFWAAVIDSIPRTGDWFPRIELQHYRGAQRFVYRERSAPERSLSARLASHGGPDPRTTPTIKGPDLLRMARLRTLAQERGADEAIILSPDGFVVEGAYSTVLWWRGDTLCVPSLDLERVDSVTAKSIIALAMALGTEVHYESVPPADLDGLEVWVASALTGIRIATGWIDGPSLAEQPGRLAMWRGRLGKLRRPIDSL